MFKAIRGLFSYRRASVDRSARERSARERSARERHAENMEKRACQSPKLKYPQPNVSVHELGDPCDRPRSC